MSNTQVKPRVSQAGAKAQINASRILELKPCAVDEPGALTNKTDMSNVWANLLAAGFAVDAYALSMKRVAGLETPEYIEPELEYTRGNGIGRAFSTEQLKAFVPAEIVLMERLVYRKDGRAFKTVYLLASDQKWQRGTTTGKREVNLVGDQKPQEPVTISLTDKH